MGKDSPEGDAAPVKFWYPILRFSLPFAHAGAIIGETVAANGRRVAMA